MARLLRFSSGRFERRTDYFYPEARAERPRVVHRDLPLTGRAEDPSQPVPETIGLRVDRNGTDG